MGYSLVRWLVHSHCSLIRLLRTARALRCAHSLDSSLTPELMGERGLYLVIEYVDIIQSQPTVHPSFSSLYNYSHATSIFHMISLFSPSGEPSSGRESQDERPRQRGSDDRSSSTPAPRHACSSRGRHRHQTHSLTHFRKGGFACARPRAIVDSDGPTVV